MAYPLTPDELAKMLSNDPTFVSDLAAGTTTTPIALVVGERKALKLSVANPTTVKATISGLANVGVQLFDAAGTQINFTNDLFDNTEFLTLGNVLNGDGYLVVTLSNTAGAVDGTVNLNVASHTIDTTTTAYPATFNEVFQSDATNGVLVHFTPTEATIFLEAYAAGVSATNGFIALFDTNKNFVAATRGDLFGYSWGEFSVTPNQDYYAYFESPLAFKGIIAGSTADWSQNAGSVYDETIVRSPLIPVVSAPTVDTLIQDALNAAKTYIDTQDASVKAYADSLISQLMNTSDLTAKLNLLNQINDILDGDAANAGFQAWQSSLARLTSAESAIVTNKEEASANLLAAFGALKTKAVITFAV